MQVSAIVVAAGKGSRLKSRLAKALIPLAGTPLVIHSLKVICSFPGIKELVLVANPANRKALIGLVKKYRIPKVSAVVLGGKRRQDSVRRGLEAVAGKSGLVLIHDAARPLVRRRLISAVINEAARTGAAIAAVRVKNTIKEAVVGRWPLAVGGKPVVKKTLNRDLLWEAQTPQVFRKDLILEAYKKYGGRDVTDDASLVEALGRKVSLVRADYSNIKITTPEDLVIAKAMVENKETSNQSTETRKVKNKTKNQIVMRQSLGGTSHSRESGHDVISPVH